MASGTIAAAAFLLFPSGKAFAQAGSLRWPTLAEITRINYGFDNDASPNALIDWRCSTRTYDSHRGHDIGVSRGTDILAAAGGWVQRRADGFGDGYPGSTDGSGFGNHVALYHDQGGYNTIYGHMTAGSGIPAMGDTLRCGDRLGGGGTSGNSSGVHLHFEIRLNVNKQNYYSGKEVDPFTGPCSTPVSYWTDQRNDKPSILCSPPVSIGRDDRAPGAAFATVRSGDPGFASALLEFGVPYSASEAGRYVVVRIHAADGRLVDSPARGPFPAGKHSLALAGEGNAPGIYFMSIAIGDRFRKTEKILKAR